MRPMGEDGVPAPVAEGSLANRPFAHLLLYVHQQELSGPLVVWPEQSGTVKGQDRILVNRGKPVAARFVAPASALDRGMLPLFTRVDAPYAFYEANLVGSGAGVVTGDVDPIALVTASLRGSAREDAIDSVLAAFGESRLRLTPRVPLVRYAFDAHETAFIDLLRAAPDTVKMLCATWGDERQGRRLIYLFAITKSIEPWTGEKKRSSGGVSVRRLADKRPSQSTGGTPAAGVTRPAQPKPAPGVKPSAPDDDFGEVPPERGPSMQPPAASTPPQRKASSRPPAEKRRSNQPEPPPLAPADLSPEHRRLWDDIRLRAERLESLNYFEMLSVGRDASSNDVRDAYFALAKKWHPDRLPEPLLPLKPWVDSIFYYATQARDTLSDEVTRAEYLRAVQAGGGTPEADRKLNAIVTAAMAVQKAEVLVRRRELNEALSILREALELNPDDADAHAMQGWIVFQMGTQTGNFPWEQLHRSFDRAIELNERSSRAHLYKATALKRQGKDLTALVHFRKVAELDPKNIEAAREVRLAEMRGGGKPGGRASKRPPKPPGDGGLFGKLFGAKKK